jgi:hypothetical protein
VIVVVGAAAVVAAALVGVPAVPLALLALVVDRPAAELLAVAAVLAALMPRLGRWAALLGLPGGVAAAATAGDGLVVALALTAFLLATHEPESGATVHPLIVAAGSWLLLAPTTLPWVGDAGLGPYQAGVIRAVAAAALLLLVTRLRTHGQAA